MVRHTRKDAPSEAEFTRLLEATTELSYPYNQQCRWILFAAGRLGLRAGEIRHMRADWIDWDREVIQIPPSDPCDFGTGGGICGYCRDQASSSYECPTEEALARRWEPKTDAGARAVPFGFSDDVRSQVVAFWDAYDEFPVSRSTINRRMDRLAEAAGFKAARIFPHCLRGGAATWHAYRGVGSAALLGLMGWKSFDVAQKYIRISGGATAEALAAAHQD